MVQKSNNNVPFLINWCKRTKKYEMRAQTSVDNAVNNLHYEIKFESCVKDKSNFLLSEKLLLFLEQKNIYFVPGDIFF